MIRSSLPRRAVLKRGKPMRKVSRKRAAENRVRRPMVAALIEDADRLCTLRVPGVCTGWASCGHELRKSSQMTGARVAKGNVRPSCDACNFWVERWPRKAHAMGLVIRSEDVQAAKDGAE